MTADAGKGAQDHHRLRLFADLRIAKKGNVLLRLDGAIFEDNLERALLAGFR
jgi:hypothetical protein